MKKHCIGRVDHVSPHYAYIVPIIPTKEKDIIVPTNLLQGALHQDLVRIVLRPVGRKKRQEGKVIEILERHIIHLVGKMKKQKKGVYFFPDHRRFHQPILLPEGVEEEFKPTDKVVVKIERWSRSHEKHIGKLVETLGPAGSPSTENNALLAQFELKETFSDVIEQEVAAFPPQLSSKELARRRDLRDLLTFTIDPHDAKDFDDALSIQLLPNGRFQIGVHIADVTHYVKHDTPLDQEARKRSTSVYLVGKVVSMLPERLANDLCSLKPNEDRPAFSVLFEMDSSAHVHEVWIGESVIHSNKRFTYEEAYAVLQDATHPHHLTLTQLNGLAKELKKERIKRGGIIFESSDTQIVLDEEGYPIDIKAKETIDTHSLIEEFMLLTNRIVAEKVVKMKGKSISHAFVYRIHDDPKPEKLEQLALFAQQIKVPFSMKTNALGQAFNQLLKQTSATPYHNITQMMAMRTMSQAVYDIDEKGHFGLGFKHYTHFTSPIRRYPDLMVHRLLKHYLSGEVPPSIPLKKITEIASQKERYAVDAERASIHYHQVLYLKQKEGTIQEGIISNIKEWGIYVQLANRCEGMVPLHTLKDDFYSLVQHGFALQGERKGRIYQIGQAVRVKIVHCDIERKVVDFALI